MRHSYDRILEAQQLRLSSSFEGLPLLSLLGLICGLLAGLVIVAFRLLMEGAAEQILPGGNIEHFEALAPLQRLMLCVGGALLIGLLLQAWKSKYRSTGVVHVMERLEYHQARLPLKNAVLQFFAATIALVSGQSLGREGPSIHLGATAGSLLGRSLRVPNNGVRILVGSGVAAAISAAFNTPLAGVIFAMEVVVMEYTVIGFAPVIVAAVSAATISRLVFGDAPLFAVPDFQINIINQLPIVVIMGALIGVISAAFIQLTIFSSEKFKDKPIILNCLLAGLTTGLIAMAIPQVMGLGYDTVNSLLLAQMGIAAILLLLLAKIVATAIAVGLGLPAGLIGPLILIGACAGGAMGLASNSLFGSSQPVSFYVILGMASMMAATLEAPLAALIYLLELTGNQAIILPGMAVVVSASMVTQVVFKKSSIYRHLMLSQGLDYRNTAMSKALRKVGVASVMERNIIKHERFASVQQARDLLRAEPRWVLLTHESDSRRNSLLPAIDLARHLNELQESAPTPLTGSENSELSTNENLVDSSHEHQIDLLNIPAKYQDTSAITIVATLQEAHDEMRKSECSVLYITGAHGATKQRIYGVITREHIDRNYLL